MSGYPVLRSAMDVIHTMTSTRMQTKARYVDAASLASALACIAAHDAGHLAARLREIGEAQADYLATARRLNRARYAMFKQVGQDDATVARRMAYRSLIENTMDRMQE